ncbi:MAG: hypothetical protein CK425_02350 [Parachlamydia sp.]|nr:MAG: hypothetical protein CK425_02350 [Parachlamydia sp.]
MDIQEKLKQIQCVIFDVDGTLTDGSMYYTAQGDFMKRFYVQDGMGLTLLARAGIEIAIITSENSPIVAARAQRLGIKHTILGCRAKKQAVEELVQKLNIELPYVAYMGDDINDEAAMKICGIKVCPSDAVSVIKTLSDYICTRAGGRGAAREFIELLLDAQEKSNTLPIVW